MAEHAGRVMKTDIKEKDDGFELVMDLPGFTKDEVKGISGERLPDYRVLPKVWIRTRKTKKAAATSAKSVMPDACETKLLCRRSCKTGR